MKYVPLKNKLFSVIKKADAVSDENKKIAADIDYIAMMCDVELDTSEEEVISEISEEEEE